MIMHEKVIDNISADRSKFYYLNFTIKFKYVVFNCIGLEENLSNVFSAFVFLLWPI